MRYAFLLLVPLVALGGLDYTELTITSVTNTQEATASTVLPVSGKIQAVHVEITPTAGTWTNDITLSTTANKGVSFQNNTIMSLSNLKGTTNYVYYPRYIVDDSSGVDLVATNCWFTEYTLLGDTLRLYATNYATAATNAIKVRVITEN